MLVAAACALPNTGSLDVGMAWLLLLIYILMQASVNTFNDYFDFIKGTDTAEDNVEASDSGARLQRRQSALGPRAGHRLSDRGLPARPVRYLESGSCPPSSSRLSGRHRRDVLRRQDASLLPSRRRGGERHRYGRSYSAGKLPGTLGHVHVHSAPLGHAHDHRRGPHHDDEQHLRYRKDIEASRRTLPVLLGRERARALYHALMVVWVLAILAIVAIWFPGGIVVLPFLALGCYPLMMGLWKNPLAAPTRIGAMGQICSVNVALGAFYAAALLL